MEVKVNIRREATLREDIKKNRMERKDTPRRDIKTQNMETGNIKKDMTATGKMVRNF